MGWLGTGYAFAGAKLSLLGTINSLGNERIPNIALASAISKLHKGDCSREVATSETAECEKQWMVPSAFVFDLMAIARACRLGSIVHRAILRRTTINKESVKSIKRLQLRMAYVQSLTKKLTQSSTGLYYKNNYSWDMHPHVASQTNSDETMLYQEGVALRTHGHLLGSEVTKVCPPPSGMLPSCPACGAYVTDDACHSLLGCAAPQLVELRNKHLPGIEGLIRDVDGDGLVLSGRERMKLIMQTTQRPESKTWCAALYNRRICQWLKEHRQAHPTYSKYCGTYRLKSLDYYQRPRRLNFDAVGEDDPSSQTCEDGALSPLPELDCITQNR